MNYLNQKQGFLGYDNNLKIDNKVVIVPFGLERSVSYGGGTKNGPKEIIKASHQVELFDEDLNKEPYKYIGIKTLKPFVIKKNLKEALNQRFLLFHKVFQGYFSVWFWQQRSSIEVCYFFYLSDVFCGLANKHHVLDQRKQFFSL